MSRTTRKRYKTFENHYINCLSETWFNKKPIGQRKADYYSSSCKWYTWKLPKEYRNSVNRTRRSIDKEQLYKELNIPEHAPNYCMWNCKSSNSWGYW